MTQNINYKFGTYRGGSAVTPSDSVGFDGSSALYVGGAGNIVVVMDSGAVLTFTSVPAGTILPVACTRVNSTGTTATSIVRLD